MRKISAWQAELLLQAFPENMNRKTANANNKENDEINVSSSDSSASSMSGNRRKAPEEEIIKYLMKMNGPVIKEDSSDSDKEKVLFDKFMNEVRSFKPELIRLWSGLQHYIYFIYRHFLSTKPSNLTEIYPSAFTKKIRELVEILIREDRTQLFLRLLVLLREFACVGKEIYKSINVSKVSTNLFNLMAYYSAFCSAADKLLPLLPEFEILLMDRFNVNWLCLNKCIFYHYIYLDPCVQAQLPLFAKLKSEKKSFHKNLIESYECFEDDMSQLTRWSTIRICIYMSSQKSALENPEVKLITDYLTYQEHIKILKTNYWIIRTEKQKRIQDQKELDAHILSWVRNIKQTADSIIDKMGHCVCDDCLSEEFTKVICCIETDSDKHARRISCYICRGIISLDSFANHVISKHQDSVPLSNKNQERKIRAARKLAKLGKSIMRGEGEGAEDTLEEEIITKFNSWDDSGAMHVMHFTLSHQYSPDSTQNSPEESKTFNCSSAEEFDRQAEKLFTEYLRNRAGLTQSQVLEACRKEAERIAKKKAAERKEKERNNSEKKETKDEKKVAKFETIERKIAAIAAHRKAAVVAAAFAAEKKMSDKKTERKPAEGKEKEEEKNKETIKKEDMNLNLKTRNAVKDEKNTAGVQDNNKKQNAFSSISKTSLSSTNQCNDLSSKHSCCDSSCSHLCNSKDEGSNICVHHKEVLKKCDCPYCEILGSTIPSASWQKNSETRDRLRSRLYQRKERDSKTTNTDNASISRNAERCSSPHVTNFKIENDPSNNVNSRVPIIPDHLNSNNISGNGGISFGNLCSHHKASRHQKQNFINTVTKSLNNIDSVLPPTASNSNVIHEPQSVLTGSVSSLSTCSLNSLRDNGDSRDINELLNFIEGNKKKDKIVLAEKKAAKKARQKKKREEEKLRIELEERRKEEERIKEEKRKEEKIEEKRRIERAALEVEKQKLKSNKKKDLKLILQPAEQSNSKKKDKKSKQKQEKEVEETIPAMVTIKRVPENGNATPTVTITLKGSTPDQDKLLFTLVNGQTKENEVANKTDKNSKKKKIEKSENKKTCKENAQNQPQSNEVQVTLSIQQNVAPPEIDSKKNKKQRKQMRRNQQKEEQMKKVEENKVDLPILKLPPGITITKIDGPAVNRNFKNFPTSKDTLPSNNQSNVTGNKSGVIVVDTEKLIQQSFLVNEKKKQKKAKKANKNVTSSFDHSPKEASVTIQSGKDNPPSMVTLKNPIFHSFQSAFDNSGNKNEKLELHAFPCNQQASIIKNENGMVTIRSPRLQQFEGGSCISSILSDLKPVIESDSSVSPSSSCFKHQSANEQKSPFNAQAILSGLPGIEITKIDKNSIKADFDTKKIGNKQLADVSIIPASNTASGNISNSINTDQIQNDKAEWYDKVFTPREDLEEDMDAAERDIEAFKRFCHQTVVPEHKEKVAHLNVQDIVFKKKTDLSFFS